VTVPLLQELDERQSRLGYISCLALVGSRDLDDRDALRYRFLNFAFQRLHRSHPLWRGFMELINAADLEELRNSRSRRKLRGALTRADEETYYVSDLWLKQDAMPSKTALLDPDRADVVIEHARHLGVLGLGYALSETGSALRAYLPYRENPGVIGPNPNPMNVYEDVSVRAGFAYSLVSSDSLLPFLIAKIVEKKSASASDAGLLLDAVDEILLVMRRIGGVGEAESTRMIAAYRERVNPTGPARDPTFGGRGLQSVSTAPERTRHIRPAKRVHKHHLRPRLENLVDVGVLGRVAGEDGFRVTETTRRAAIQLEGLRGDPRKLRYFLDRQFFGSWARIQGMESRLADRNEVIRFFSLAYDRVKRSIGFTPARTVALATSLLALRHGLVAEVANTMEMVLEAAKGPLNGYFQFSGGTRLDHEYMIRVRPEIREILD
jgi:hypothetical protein